MEHQYPRCHLGGVNAAVTTTAGVSSADGMETVYERMDRMKAEEQQKAKMEAEKEATAG
jgi:hypothetical protein